MTLLFISDMHFCAERLEKVELFCKLLKKPARAAKALYILGDSFEVWAGDDDITHPHPTVIKAMADYTRANGQLFVMRGNRDFLINQQFSKNTGCQLLKDKTLISINKQPTLLMHGDALCTEDKLFQLWRHIAYNRQVQKLLMTLSYAKREKLWHTLRKKFKKTTQKQPKNILDVYQPTIEKVMKEYRVLRLIHGHTHKKAIHKFTIDGEPAERIVLGDWVHEDSILVANENGLTLMRVEEYIAATT